jgi:hypothetical protein
MSTVHHDTQGMYDMASHADSYHSPQEEWKHKILKFHHLNKI